MYRHPSPDELICIWKKNCETYTFDKDHLQTNYERKAYQDTQFEDVNTDTDLPTDVASLVQTTAYTYNDDNLPTQLSDRIYTRGSTSYMLREYNFTYDDKGNVLTEKYPNGQTTTYTYNASYSIPLTKTYQQNSSTTIVETNTLTSDGKNIASSEVNSNGTVVSKTGYTYGTDGRVSRVRTYIDATRYVDHLYAYGNAANLTEHKVTGVKTVTGGTAAGSPGYAAGTIAEAFQYDGRGRLTLVKNGKGSSIEIDYDPLGRITCVTYPNGSTESYDYSVHTHTSTDTPNTVTYTNRAGTAFRYRYDKAGNLTEVYDETGNRALKKLEYDSSNRPISEIIYSTYGPSAHTKYRYDTLDRVITLRKVNASGAATYEESYTYTDGAGKTEQRIVGDSSAPAMTNTFYTDNMGNTVKRGRYIGSTETLETYLYDYLGNRIQTKRDITTGSSGVVVEQAAYNYAGQPTSVTNAGGKVYAYQYDWLGRQSSGTDPKNSRTQYSYDVLGRLLEEKTPFTVIDGTTLYASTRYTYDAGGNITTRAVSNGAAELNASASWSTTEYAYDSSGNLVRVTGHPSGSTSVYTQYYYDAAGNLARVYTGQSAPLTVSGLDQVSGSPVSVTKYTYDGYGNLISMTDPLNRLETSSYDQNGRLRSRTDRNGNITSYTYDERGNTTGITVKTSGGQTLGTLTNTFSKTGQLASTSSGSQTIQYKYDSGGRMIQETAGTTVKTYTYNYQDLCTGVSIKQNGTSKYYATYEYNALGQLLSMTGKTSTGTAATSVSATYSYDANGNCTSVCYPDIIPDEGYQTYSYNNANLVTNTTIAGGYTYDYTYLLDGNQSSLSSSGNTIQYTYDGMGRLSEETRTRGSSTVYSKAYGYDRRGNRTSLTTGTGSVSYTYDACNRLLSMTDSTGGSTKTTAYTYDNNGNTLTESQGTNSIVYGYDGFNRQTSATVNGASTSDTYGPDGLRTGKGSVSYVWSGGELVLEGNTRYFYGLDLIAKLTGYEFDEVYYFHDAHGNVVTTSHRAINSTANSALEGEDQGAVQRKPDPSEFEYIFSGQEWYDAFGVRDSSIVKSGFGYCGEYLDRETQNYYLRARYYDPEIGRFVNEDIIRNGENWYIYCNNNPVTFCDTYGLEPIAVRATIEGLGGNVSWNNEYKYATVTLDGNSVFLHGGDFIGTYIDNGVMYTDDEMLFLLLGSSFSLGKGWSGRIDRGGAGKEYMRHVHILKDGKEWIQNEDGSPHDHHKNPPGSPPRGVLKELKKQKNWDWEQKEADWISKIEIIAADSGYYFITYPNGRQVTIYEGTNPISISAYPSNRDLKGYYYEVTYTEIASMPTNTMIVLPFVSPTTGVIPGVVPVPIPVP